MAYSVAYQHTDSNRNYDGSDKLHGIKKVGTDRKSVGPQFYYVPPVPPVLNAVFRRFACYFIFYLYFCTGINKSRYDSNTDECRTAP